VAKTVRKGEALRPIEETTAEPEPALVDSEE
jgi:hypothetical protein